MTLSRFETSDGYDAVADSYGCWRLGVAAGRELRIRRGELPPSPERPNELRWACEGECPVDELDAVRVNRSNENVGRRVAVDPSEFEPLPRSIWYAAHTMAGQETKATANLTRGGFWTFFPHYRVKRRVGRRRRLVESLRPLFPRYTFVALRYRHEALFDVENTVGVARVVSRRFTGEPMQIPGPVMTEIMDRADDAGLVEEIKPPHWFKGKIGDVIRLSDNPPFFGLIAQLSSLAELDKSGQISIWLEMLGAEREIAVPATAVAEIVRPSQGEGSDGAQRPLVRRAG